MNRYTYLWARATRHAPLLLFGLIAGALLPTAPALAQAHVPAGAHAALGAPGVASAAPLWLSPQFLAGLAALVAALADGASKVIYAVRKPSDLEVCPFALAGVARCHGLRTPVPPPSTPKQE